ncbi:tRNA (adenosine(37)-N6)-dimethylallyltransferase MiaA [Faecalispora anaeroviscerum]|uniref:tRNA (adenosine(37)-N6)-dimethylallyltransferase MiaA n=1 Tax=Faecalispora anaeroviscerum TaxID=2991836 RepID=UPI0024BB97BE|nr:tRNA (adenosine(37)-N6)-dimethylallyltransferase MiaA [Faecalispora anaeroviscerum]
MPEEKIPLLVVGGPTASGKTRLAAEVALRHHGEVVSADSMQIYRGMEIGTAKPTPEETLGVPHHLMGFVEPGQSFSVADYVSLAKETVEAIHSRGHLPVLAGGTGLYIRSLITNTQFTEADNDPALRAALLERAEREGTDGLMQELRSFDPESAERIEPRNLPRLIRAIELYRVTGVTMTEHLRRSRMQPSPYRVCFLCLGFRDRAKLYERIDLRVDEMFRRGLVEEARELLETPSGATAMQAIGYKELLPFFRGEIPLAEAQDTIKRETRRYAKRQLTWFRREEQAHWLFVDDYPQWGALRDAAEEIIRGKLYE